MDYDEDIWNSVDQLVKSQTQKRNQTQQLPPPSPPHRETNREYQTQKMTRQFVNQAPSSFQRNGGQFGRGSPQQSPGFIVNQRQMANNIGNSPTGVLQQQVKSLQMTLESERQQWMRDFSQQQDRIKQFSKDAQVLKSERDKYQQELEFLKAEIRDKQENSTRLEVDKSPEQQTQTCRNQDLKRKIENDAFLEKASKVQKLNQDQKLIRVAPIQTPDPITAFPCFLHQQMDILTSSQKITDRAFLRRR
eukprot:TRINITY_DN139443_c0_g1_i1.p1 TRINITY_DN139443_c0_g1~~TRINITY_DN139443_c0_g1_i1.p1  ORF type:complete len:260 (+),score=33.30 TRINITY_DN139443_c0_g1_i1:39-782(+)